MAERIKAVIFDWAGTTIDYGCFAPIKGFIEGFKSIGIGITDEMAREPMGLSKLDHTRAIARMLPSPIAEEEIIEAYRVFEQTMFESIGDYCDVKDFVVDTVDALRLQGIKIGSTTGYTPEMMDRILPKAAKQGYSPDFCAAPLNSIKGRPYPYMVWNNLIAFEIIDPREAVKVGDTIADIAEGINANTWTVGVIMGSSELGLSRDDVERITGSELQARKDTVRAAYYKAGADYIIDDMNELIGVLADINRKLAQNADRKLLTPGPLSTRHSVKHAMLTDHCTWDDEYKEITASVCHDIEQISANSDYASVLLQGSGTYAVEAMINCLNGDGEKALFLVNGEYGRRMLEIAKRAGKNYDCLEFGDTEPIAVGALEQKLMQDEGISTVIFVHCETTTGIINPLEDIAKLANLYGKKVFIDAMSSFGAYEIDMPALGIHALAASSNKCLEGLPGLSFVLARKDLIIQSQAQSKSLSLDLYSQYKELYEGSGKFRFTSPTNILLALRQALDEYKKEGGLQARKLRYINNHRVLVDGLKELGIKPIISPENQSYIITTFELGDLSFPTLYEALKQKGFIIYPGKLTDMPTFRIGNIGDVYPSDMLSLVATIKESIALAYVNA
ncbi:MAG: 2-aminoethylphosphonate--pyruvate transaminase [Eubacteriaceae bacterium]|nr:2-aminoethylphosphonate--pyruvate transaminase [Eubacteriaceae bacterium]